MLHPDFKYGRNFTADVALLHLSRPVPFPTVKLEKGSSAALAPGERWEGGIGESWLIREAVPLRQCPERCLQPVTGCVGSAVHIAHRFLNSQCTSVLPAACTPSLGCSPQASTPPSWDGASSRCSWLRRCSRWAVPPRGGPAADQHKGCAVCSHAAVFDSSVYPHWDNSDSHTLCQES